MPTLETQTDGRVAQKKHKSSDETLSSNRTKKEKETARMSNECAARERGRRIGKLTTRYLSKKTFITRIK
jgi:ribosomal protein L19E